MSQAAAYLVSLINHAPVLLVYLVAFVLALVFMRRARTPAILTLVGAGILVLTTIGVALVQAYLVESRQDGGHTGLETAQAMGLVRIAGSCLRAAGLSLLVAAIFVGRQGVGAGRSQPL